jgi:UDP-glucose 4-epimerase/UDP-arabinose 4-epimerase
MAFSPGGEPFFKGNTMQASRLPTVLVTGGAGYIGSHTARALARRGARLVVYDNLSMGYREAVRWGEFVEGDIRDGSALREAMRRYDVSAVLHFAGLIEVARSFQQPDLFFDVNVRGTEVLLSAMRDAGVAHLVFSSSAAVYGSVGDSALISEDAHKAPASPYGETKLAGEDAIRQACRATGMTAVALRYFNAAGSEPSGVIGEAHNPETHLIPLALDAALGRRRALTVFGLDHPTPDGSCLRDYVHVDDLADAHVAALDFGQLPGQFDAFNVGTGRGRSVLEIIEAIERMLGRPVPYAVGPRRVGDPASLVADPSRAKTNLRWSASASSLEHIVETALVWRTSAGFAKIMATAERC